MSRLALAEECSAIEDELRMTPGRHGIELRSRWAVTVDQMMRHLNEHRPAVIHFSGHGCAAGDAPAPPRGDPAPGRDVERREGAGILLQGEHGSQYVSERALAQVITSAAGSARVVVLNACWTDAVARSLCAVVDCVVGMAGAIEDGAARAFARGFYRALGHGRSVGNAAAQAIASLAAAQLSGAQLPVCRTRAGVCADRIFLSA